VIKLAGVTSVAAGDLQLGAQGTGATVSLAAATIPAVSTTASNATSSTKTTAKDDTINSAASTALVGSGAAIDGGLGSDTLNATLATQGLLTSLTTAGSAGVAVTNVETINLTVTTPSAVVNLGSGVPTTTSTLTLTGSNGDGALQATTTAAGQTFTVTNTNGTTASTITMADLANTSVTTGSAGDTIIVNGGSATKGLSVNAGAGADTVRVDAATGWSGLGNSLNGGSNLTGTVDTLSINYDTAAVSLALPTMITAGDIAGFEKLTVSNMATGTATITGGTGFTQYDFSASSDANDVIVLNVSGAQAAALTSVVFDTSATSSLVVVPATGETSTTVNYSGTDVLTFVDTINFGSTIPMTLTLGNQVLPAVTQTGSGSATTEVTIGSVSTLTVADITTDNSAQAVTAVTSGAVTFNVPLNTLQNISGVVTANGNAYDAGDITLASAAAATTTLNISGTATTATTVAATAHTIGTVNLLDGDLVLTNANLDVIKLGGITTATTVSYGDSTSTTILAGSATETALRAGPKTDLTAVTTNASITLSTDSGNATGTTVLVVDGFTAGAGTGFDVIDLGGTIVAQPGIATTGAAATQGAAGSFTDLLVLTAATSQISGSLTQDGNAQDVEAKIIAAGITLASQTATQGFYAVLDNGTDTGIYRVTLAATAGTAGIIDNVADFSVQLVGVLNGISDAGTLAAANFG